MVLSLKYVIVMNCLNSVIKHKIYWTSVTLYGGVRLLNGYNACIHCIIKLYRQLK